MVFGNSEDKRPRFTFNNQQIGRECLCSILGIGVNRLRKAFGMVPDLRIGKSKTGSREETWSVDSFLSMLYDSVAETLPDRFIRRHRQQRADDEDFDVSGSGDEADVEDLKDWLDDPGKGAVWESFQPNSKKVAKYLDPGTVTDLFTHYQATRQLYGATAVSQHCGYMFQTLPRF